MYLFTIKTKNHQYIGTNIKFESGVLTFLEQQTGKIRTIREAFSITWSNEKKK